MIDVPRQIHYFGISRVYNVMQGHTLAREILHSAVTPLVCGLPEKSSKPSQISR